MPRLEELQNFAESLTGTYLRSRTREFIEPRMLDFVKEYCPPRLPMVEGHLWFRIRKCSDGKPFNHLNELLYREDGSPIGRANFDGDKILYASVSIETALEEMGVEVGDVVQVVALQSAPTRLVVAPILGMIRNYWKTRIAGYGENIMDAHFMHQIRTDLAKFERSAYVDTVLAEVFGRPYKRPWEYKLTAAVAKHLTEGSMPLLFPSVEDHGGMNIAIPAAIFDTEFQVNDTAVLSVTGVFHHGFYSYTPQQVTNSFTKDGAISWLGQDPNVAPPSAKWKKSAPL